LLEHVKQKLPRMGAEKRELPRAISFRVNYVSENTSAHNAHQKPTDNTRTDATTSRTTTNDNGIRQLAAEIWDQGKSPGVNT
jgi:hypothetical protein